MRRSALSPDEIRDLCEAVGIKDYAVTHQLSAALGFSSRHIRRMLRGDRRVTEDTRKRLLAWIAVRKDEQECERLLIKEMLQRLA